MQFEGMCGIGHVMDMDVDPMNDWNISPRLLIGTAAACCKTIAETKKSTMKVARDMMWMRFRWVGKTTAEPLRRGTLKNSMLRVWWS
uniref:Uncharacterized protein n=1 Tax=Pristionchus pacificus TaxID=54126 RepID=A0A2A6C5Z9_PRIPA|eukprot:PDM73560.1 hypothetical protein PRIPAC_40916 [Pristionchus pacificus]